MNQALAGLCDEQKLLAKQSPQRPTAHVKTHEADGRCETLRHRIRQESWLDALDREARQRQDFEHRAIGERQEVIPEIPIAPCRKRMFGPRQMIRPPGFKQRCASSKVRRKASLSRRCSKKLLVKTTSSESSGTFQRAEQSCSSVSMPEPTRVGMSGLRSMPIRRRASMWRMNSPQPQPRSSTVASRARAAERNLAPIFSRLHRDMERARRTAARTPCLNLEAFPCGLASAALGR